SNLPEYHHTEPARWHKVAHFFPKQLQRHVCVSMPRFKQLGIWLQLKHQHHETVKGNIGAGQGKGIGLQ
ncbi:hypothetical protein PAXRUDRAFT_796104, partial [Paxillus rubicundulus Ve08.2h10]